MMYPVLYSFRRCPYAIRARLALRVSGIQVILREVVLANKPSALLACSPKATVPVLVLTNKQVIDESLDIMMWALHQNDPHNWLVEGAGLITETLQLILSNDNDFKPDLDRYKYADRFPEKPMETYRTQGERFLKVLETRLATSPFLLGERPTLADMAILPFVRQFAHVDIHWFELSPYVYLRTWLSSLLDQALFNSVMQKYSPWREGDPVQVF